MKTILITGANRGIGYEMAKQSLAAGDRVFAGCRSPETAVALQELSGQFDQLTVVQLDVSEDRSVVEAATAVAAQTDHIDWLINNAGINLRHNLERFSADEMLQTFNVNSVGPMRVAVAFAPLLRRGTAPKMVNVSSQLGSLAKARKGWGGYSYNASKAALNMIVRQLAFDLAEDGVITIVIHPGWVATDMGGKDAAVTPPDSAAGILQVTAGLTAEDNSEFFVYNGERHVW